MTFSSFRAFVVTLVFYALGHLSVAAAQSAEFLSVDAWRLRFDYSVQSSAQTGEQQFDYTVTVSGDALLERDPDNNKTYRGDPNITVSVQYGGMVIDSEGCGLSEMVTSVGAPDCSNGPRLFLGTDTFELMLNCSYVPVTHTHEWLGSCGQMFEYPVDGDPLTEWEWPAQAHAFDSGLVKFDFPYPQTGVALADGDSGELQGFLAPLFTAIGYGTPTPLSYDFSFSLTPDSTEELKLEIDSPLYDPWRPTTDIQGEPGEPLPMTARLVSSSGRDPLARITRVEWSLEETSREPGFSMNYPTNALDEELDLRLAGLTETSHEITEEGQRATQYSPKGFSDTINVMPYDWGGWSTLSVTATLSDGRRIVGKLKGQSEEGARLPKRAATSFIADSWKRAYGVSNQADNADDDNTPLGDGTKGDGLSLYQEYRGFVEAAEFIEGDPRVKDFFVCNRAHWVATAGIARFARHSKLRVHSELRESELPSSRVINGNRAMGPPVTDQHAVILQVIPKQKGYAEATGGPSTPKNITLVKIMGDWLSLDSTYRSKVIAHELFHCVNTYHHGETDYEVTWRKNMSGVLVEKTNGGAYEGTPIRVLRESRTDITDEIARLASEAAMGRFKITIGVDHGQNSGFDNCVMRYNNANAYVSKQDASVRYFAQEHMGSALCSTADGTGPNAPDRDPQSRYSSAAPKRGNCVSQLLVTDAATPPVR